MLEVYECIPSTGFLSKNFWSTSNDCRSASMDDQLLKERGYTEPFYFACAGTEPNKKPQQLFTCTLCGKEYAWMYSLRRHQLQCGDKEARNKCNFCTKKFYRRDRLKEHLLTHHQDLI